MNLSKNSKNKSNSKVLIHPRYKNNAEPVLQPEKQQSYRGGVKKTVYVLGAVVFALVLFAFGNVYWVNLQLDKEIIGYGKQLEELKSSDLTLHKEIELLNDPIYIERLAREKLGLVKTGERVVVPTTPGEIAPLQEVKDEIRH